MLKKRLCSFVTALAMTATSVPFLASVIYSNTASTPAYAQGEFTIPELDIKSKAIPDLDCFKFAADMELGINLGNTFDAYDDAGINSNKLDIESSWCGVKTTKEMIDTMKQAGFQTIRIPVSWHNHVDDNFNIDEAWLNRVQEVVDYAVANDMHIILNIHHDNESEKKYMFPDSEHLENSLKYVSSIWTQVADKFKDYDDHLVFESLNEPRLIGSDYEWWFNQNAPECIDAQNCINQMNQKFVDIVRASGGNNANRYLMVPAYCANADAAASDLFKLPKDTAENKLMVEVHAYIPYKFAMAAPGTADSVDTFDVNKDTGDIDSLMDSLYLNFIKKNVPVIIDEFGARNKDENIQARTNYATYYIAAARARGITCCWWDNNAFDSYSGEAFGLLDRKANVIKYPSIAEGLSKYANDDKTSYVTPSSSDDRIGLVNKTESGASAMFSRAIGDKVEVDIKLNNNTGSLMGCIDFSVQLNGEYYWIAYQYNVTESGTVQFDINKPDMVNVGDDPVSDEAIKKELIESIKKMNSINIQCWYASDKSGKEITPSTDAGEFTGARIIGEKTPNSGDNEGLVNKTESGASAMFSEAIGDKVEVDIELGKNTGSLMGCIDFSVQLNGEYYWIAYQYNVTKSGTVQFDINKPDMVNIGDEPVADEAIKKELIAAIKKMNSINIQCWYASDKSGKEITPSTDAGEFTGARIVKDSNPTTTKTVWGDANDDGSVDVADVVAVAAYVGDAENNNLKEKGLTNADVHNNGNGITADDALVIQQYLAKIIPSLDPTASNEVLARQSN